MSSPNSATVTTTHELPPGTILISVPEYDQLCDDARFLSALMQAGVDNWDWYGEALRIYNEDLEESD